jgi:ABC-type bacteriocin/lantibiotic exporter with double-glycine peptidase domain
MATGRIVRLVIACCLLSVVISLLIPRRAISSVGCGPRSLRHALNALGLPATEPEVFARFPDGGDTVSFAQMERAAARWPVRVAARQMTVEAFRRERCLGVLHVDGVHFVAAVGHEAEAVWIVDPLYRGEQKPVRWLYADLPARWSGKILVIERR